MFQYLPGDNTSSDPTAFQHGRVKGFGQSLTQLQEHIQIGTQVAADLVLRFEHSTRSDTVQEAYTRVRAYFPFLLHSLRRLNLEHNQENTYRLAGGPPYRSQAAHNARQARGAFPHIARCAILCDLTIPADIRNAWAAFEGFAGRQDNLSGLFRIPFIASSTLAARFPRSRNSQRGANPSTGRQSVASTTLRLTTSKTLSFMISEVPGRGKTPTLSLEQFQSNALACPRHRGRATLATTTTTRSPSHAPIVDSVTGYYTRDTMSMTRRISLLTRAISIGASATKSNSASHPSATGSLYTSNQATPGSTSQRPTRIQVTH